MKRIEDFLQFECAQWLRKNRIDFCAVPNGAVFRSAREGARMKALGMVNGVHDLLLFFDDGLLVLVELKTIKGELSPAQVKWHERMTRLCFHHYIIQSDCKIEIVRQLSEIVERHQ